MICACGPASLICTFLVLARPTGVRAQSAPAPAAAGFQNAVNAVSKGANSPERGAAIIRRLQAAGIPFRLEPFCAEDRLGTNIVADLPGAGARTLVLGAHYDRVMEGKGAVDNASGAAAVLELLTRLKARPLRNYSVRAVFFDQEEAGLVGSRAYVATSGKTKRRAADVFLNFDVFGYGDTLFVWADGRDGAAGRALLRAAADAKFPLQMGKEYPPSDHLAFTSAKVEALSFSLIPGAEVAGVRAVLRGETPVTPPRILGLIHTAEDTVAKVEADAAVRAITVVEGAIRTLDRAPSPKPSSASTRPRRR